MVLPLFGGGQKIAAVGRLRYDLAVRNVMRSLPEDESSAQHETCYFSADHYPRMCYLHFYLSRAETFFRSTAEDRPSVGVLAKNRSPPCNAIRCNSVVFLGSSTCRKDSQIAQPSNFSYLLLTLLYFPFYMSNFIFQHRLYRLLCTLFLLS